MINVLQLCDCFSKAQKNNPQENGRSKKKKKSWFGSVLTIILVSATAIYLGFLIQNHLATDKFHFQQSTRPSTSQTILQTSKMCIGVTLNELQIEMIKKNFDVILTTHRNTKIEKKILQLIEFVPCSFQCQQNLASNTKIKQQNLLCIPPDLNLVLSGDYTSPKFEYIQIRLRRCNSTRNKCSTDDEFNSFMDNQGYFTFNIYFKNILINPTLAQNYKQDYLQDKNYISFNKNQGQLVNIYFSKFTIESYSKLKLIPYITTYLKPEEQFGIKVNSIGQHLPLLDQNRIDYAKFVFRRQISSYYLERHIQTIDELLAYLGPFLSLSFAGLFSSWVKKYHQNYKASEPADIEERRRCNLKLQAKRIFFCCWSCFQRNQQENLGNNIMNQQIPNQIVLPPSNQQPVMSIN